MSFSDITIQPADAADATDPPTEPLPLKREPSKSKRNQKSKEIEIAFKFIQVEP